MTEFEKYEQLKSDSNIGKPGLETLDYDLEQPIKTGVAILEQYQMRTGNCPHCGEDWRTHDYSCKDEQPNQSARGKNPMIFEQIDGCCDIIEKLLGELVPKTSQVEGCIKTHNSWRNNNLKHLREVFE